MKAFVWIGFSTLATVWPIWRTSASVCDWWSWRRPEAMEVCVECATPFPYTRVNFLWSAPQYDPRCALPLFIMRFIVVTILHLIARNAFSFKSWAKTNKDWSSYWVIPHWYDHQKRPVTEESPENDFICSEAHSLHQTATWQLTKRCPILKRVNVTLVYWPWFAHNQSMWT